MSSRRKSALSKLEEKISTRSRQLVPNASDQGFWNELYRRLLDGRVVPILGNAVRNNRIFEIDDDNDAGVEETNREAKESLEALDQDAPDHLSVEEELAKLWARRIGYPLPDQPRLARVAQFNRVISDDMQQAKSNYLQFLKECLLDVAEEDELVVEIAAGLRTQLIEKSFSEMVAELDYPRFTITRPDPLRVLAKLRLPIYVTTSYYDFLERALRAEGANNVRTRFCLWNMESESVSPEHLPDPPIYSLSRRAGCLSPARLRTVSPLPGAERRRSPRLSAGAGSGHQRQPAADSALLAHRVGRVIALAAWLPSAGLGLSHSLPRADHLPACTVAHVGPYV